MFILWVSISVMCTVACSLKEQFHEIEKGKFQWSLKFAMLDQTIKSLKS